MSDRNDPRHVKDLKSEMSLTLVKTENMGEARFISYKGITLWNTVDTSLDNYEIYLYDGSLGGTKFDDPITLTCVDGFGDHYHYGHWETLEEAFEWLKNPYPLRRATPTFRDIF